ncbi:MAG: hypothetical protein F6K22_19820 [Okeania sp. SIO2F4]|uniref:hypothetical protein n=1 Tax=Okeania sp. SIO2F4 TaxID=2607790 RepID=UPI00142C6A56|nr:hypothetical protein [Okeania sp. SIO2F4]NES04884.1 hypothetical protein [Okeania sp. SIO2F4]
MKQALGKVIVAFLVCLLSFAVVSPSPAMADEYYCFLEQEPECVTELPLSGDLLFEDIPPYGVNFIDVTFSNYSPEYEAVVNSDIDNPILIPPYNSERRIYQVVPQSSVTFSNASNFPDTLLQIRTFGYSD